MWILWGFLCLLWCGQNMFMFQTFDWFAIGLIYNFKKNNLRSVSRWGSPSCRWWRGWRSKPRCTRGHCHSEWSCWLTGCRCCWCSRRSYSCPSPFPRSQKPTRRWSPNPHDPEEHAGHLGSRTDNEGPFHSCLDPPKEKQQHHNQS